MATGHSGGFWLNLSPTHTQLNKSQLASTLLMGSKNKTCILPVDKKSKPLPYPLLLGLNFLHDPMERV